MDQQEQTPSTEQYILVALIDIYRGLKTNLPVNLDKQLQNKVLRDVLSTAISNAQKQESMQTISDQLFKCVCEGYTLHDEMEIVQSQTPDIINAKTIAAAYLLKLLNQEANLQ